MKRLRRGCHRLGLDRRDTQVLRRHLVSAASHATPRRAARSKRSQKNVQHTERLIAQGRMQPAGLVHVEAARSDGRWAPLTGAAPPWNCPKTFFDSAAKGPLRPRFLRYAQTPEPVCYLSRLHSAKRAETRQKRMTKLPANLARDESPRNCRQRDACKHWY